jgi:hypothetical protein
MWFSVKPECAGKSFYALWSKKIHPTFSVYLAVRRLLLAKVEPPPAKVGEATKQFLRTYLSVPGGGDSFPYVRPFITRGEDKSEQTWLNKNSSGSFAWSSSRGAIKTFLERNKKEVPDYALKDRHAELVRSHLFDKDKDRIHIAGLIAFLYRDFAFEADKPSFAPLLDRFAQEFAFKGSEGTLTSDFRILFIDDTDEMDSDDWFMACDAPISEGTPSTSPPDLR